jgi:hypothetical protein
LTIHQNQVTDAKVVESVQENSLFSPDVVRFGDRLHILVNKFDTERATMEEFDIDDDTMRLNATYTRVHGDVSRKLPQGPWRANNIHLASSRNYMLCRKLLSLGASRGQMTEQDRKHYKQLFGDDDDAPEELSAGDMSRLQEEETRTYFSRFLKHLRTSVVNEGAKWALSQTAALVGFVLDKVLAGQRIQLENIENRAFVIVFQLLQLSYRTPSAVLIACGVAGRSWAS